LRRIPALLLSLVFCMSATAQSKGGNGEPDHASQARVTRADLSLPRDARGRIKRDRAARAAFQHEHPCPSTGRTSGACPGYVVDHVMPLKRGGADRPWNMQWQTREAAKEKDKWE
jgi:hypothetical protein